MPFGFVKNSSIHRFTNQTKLLIDYDNINK